MGDGARVSIFFFTKNTIFRGFFFGWGEGVQLVNFFTKNPNLKKVEGDARVCDFFTKYSNLKKTSFFVGGGGGRGL